MLALDLGTSETIRDVSLHVSPLSDFWIYLEITFLYDLGDHFETALQLNLICLFLGPSNLFGCFCTA